nr:MULTISPECIES: metallopeptidase family protein [unclassified Schaalia]
MHRSPFRDRHGRGLRYVLFPPSTPRWRTRREHFDALVARIVAELTERWPAVGTIEFAVEDVPPSLPAFWEDSTVILARIFPADRRRGLPDRIVIHRLPVLQRVTSDQLAVFLRRLIIERISHILTIPPDELEKELS